MPSRTVHVKAHLRNGKRVAEHTRVIAGAQHKSAAGKTRSGSGPAQGKTHVRDKLAAASGQHEAVARSTIEAAQTLARGGKLGATEKGSSGSTQAQGKTHVRKKTDAAPGRKKLSVSTPASGTAGVRGKTVALPGNQKAQPGKQKSSGTLQSVRRYANAVAGVADYYTAGIASTVAGLLPWNNLADTKRAAQAAQRDAARLFGRDVLATAEAPMLGGIVAVGASQRLASRAVRRPATGNAAPGRPGGQADPTKPSRRARLYQTGELVPSAKSKHLEGVQTQGWRAKTKFTDERAFFGRSDPTLDAALGGKTKATGRLTGAYKPPDGPLEVNPLRPYARTVPVNKTGDLSKRLSRRLDAQGAFKAAMDVQDAVPSHYVVPSTTVRGMPGVVLTGRMDRARITAIAKQGVPIAHTSPRSATLLSDKSAEQAAYIAQFGGQPARWSGPDFISFKDQWAAPPGSGAVTRKMLGYIDAAPGMAKALSSKPIRQHYAKRPALDAAAATQRGIGPAREDIANLHRIFGKGGIRGVKKALKRGVSLPVAAGVVIGATRYRPKSKRAKPLVY